jgi:hypothetical protein
MFRKWIFLLASIPVALPAQTIDTFFQDTFQTMLRNDPDFATGVGHHEYDDRWTDYSQAARESRRHFVEQSLTALGKFPAGM